MLGRSGAPRQRGRRRWRERRRDRRRRVRREHRRWLLRRRRPPAGGTGGFGGEGGFGGSDACGCDDEWPLHCYCDEFSCPSYEEAIENPFCQGGGPSEPQTVTGCGQIVVQLPAGVMMTTYVYSADGLTLLGAGHVADLAHGVCDDNGYFAGIAPVECEDAEEDPLCP